MTTTTSSKPSRIRDGAVAPGDRRRTFAMFGVIVAMHIAAFGMLFGLVDPGDFAVGGQVFGIGLGITAYTFGLRHAFDADHIAAIDNTTRKLVNDGRQPRTIGFWFAMGHSAVVFVLATLVAVGAHLAGTLLDDNSSMRRDLGVLGTIASGSFLYVIGILNLIALVGIWRVFRRLRTEQLDAEQFEKLLASRGLLSRILAPVMRSITAPWQMVLVGFVFGIGFDTATEVALLTLAGSGAASGLPWYAVLVLPLLFAAGMTLMDAVDGLLMNAAYNWAFTNPVRKVFYNLTITGLSVAVALLIGSIELVTVLHDDLGWHNPVVDWISGVDLGKAGYIIVGLFVAAWVCAVGYWRLAGVEQRWMPESTGRH